MKAHIQQENDELQLDNQTQVNVTNDYDDSVQLPMNNAPRLASFVVEVP